MSRIKIELPFSGFYESLHDDALDQALESNYWNDQGEIPEVVADALYMASVDWGQIQTEYCRRYTEVLADELELDLKFDEMTSPKYYNFSTDRLFATIPAGQLKKIRQAVEKHEGWPGCIKDNFTSYDGFSSNYSNDATDPEWTAPILDECQYRVMINFWIREILERDPYELEISLIEEINAYELDTIQDAAGVVDAYLDEKKIPANKAIADKLDLRPDYDQNLYVTRDDDKLYVDVYGEYLRVMPSDDPEGTPPEPISENQLSIGDLS